MLRQIQIFYEFDDGATVIEYALLASVVAIGAFAAVINLGDAIEAMFGLVANGVSNAV